MTHDGIITAPGGSSIPEHFLPFGKFLPKPLRAAGALECCLSGWKSAQVFTERLLCGWQRCNPGRHRAAPVECTLQCRRHMENKEATNSSNGCML